MLIHSIGFFFAAFSTAWRPLKRMRIRNIPKYQLLTQLTASESHGRTLIWPIFTHADSATIIGHDMYLGYG